MPLFKPKCQVHPKKILHVSISTSQQEPTHRHDAIQSNPMTLVFKNSRLEVDYRLYHQMRFSHSSRTSMNGLFLITLIIQLLFTFWNNSQNSFRYCHIGSALIYMIWSLILFYFNLHKNEYGRQMHKILILIFHLQSLLVVGRICLGYFQDDYLVDHSEILIVTVLNMVALATVLNLLLVYFILIIMEYLVVSLIFLSLSIHQLQDTHFRELISIVMLLFLIAIGLHQTECSSRNDFLKISSLSNTNLNLIDEITQMQMRLKQNSPFNVEVGVEGVFRALARVKNSTNDIEVVREINRVINTLLSGKEIYNINTTALSEHAAEVDVSNWMSILNQHRQLSRIDIIPSLRRRDSSRNVCHNVNMLFGDDTKAIEKAEQLATNVCNTFDYDIFSLQEGCKHPLAAVLIATMEKQNLFLSLNLSTSKFTQFGIAIESRYKATNPYHNALHATSVVWDIAFYLSHIQSGVDDLSFVSALVAGAIHDVNHPGLNNRFLIHSKDALAITYSDDSVLERMHLAEAFQIARLNQCNIFADMTEEQRTKSRKMIISMVLATDLTKHMQHVALLQTKKYGVSEESRNIDTVTMLQTVILLADLGHAAKPFKYHKIWSTRVQDEFYEQGDLEKKGGLEISPLCDRDNTKHSSAQLGFFVFLVKPLFLAAREAFRIDTFDDILKEVENNEQQWKLYSMDSEVRH